MAAAATGRIGAFLAVTASLLASAAWPEALTTSPCRQATGAAAAEILCAESPERRSRLSVRFDRRITTPTGLLGQFDGFLVDYRLANGITLNGMAGYPALAAEDEFNPERQVFGVGATTRKFAGAWELGSYLVEQQGNGRDERRAIGGAVRYLRPNRGLLLSVDYDAEERALGALTISGAWKLLPPTTLSTTLDVRRSQLATPQARYIQQTLASTPGWQRGLPEDRINALMGSSSTGVRTLAVGLSHNFSRRLSLSGDVAVLDLWNDDLGNDQTAVTPEGNEYFCHLKLTGKELMLPGDRSVLDLRHSVAGDSRTASATLNTQFDINPLWQISPRLRTDFHSDKRSSAARWVTSSGVKMAYRCRRDYTLQLEAGGEWATHNQAAAAQDSSSYFFKLDYQAQF